MINRRRYMGDKVLFELHNRQFDGTVNDIIDTGLKLWQYDKFKLELEFDLTSSQIHMATIFTCKPDVAPYSGIRIRIHNNSTIQFMVSEDIRLTNNPGGYTFTNSQYGNSALKPRIAGMNKVLIIRNGNSLHFEINGQAADAEMSNVKTSDINLLLGCDYSGTSDTQRYYKGVFTKFILTQ